MMSELGLQMGSYLRQVVPMLQTYKQAVSEITHKNLKIREKEKDRGVSFVYLIFEVRPDEQQGKRVRSHIPSVTDDETDVKAFCLIEQVKVFADKMRDVIFRVLVANEEMKKVDSTLSRKIKKLTELKKSLDEFTRLLDTIVTFYSARFLGFHPTVDLPALEAVEKLNEQLSHLKNHLNKDELSSLFALYDAEFNISKEVIICSILGLSDDYGLYLQELDTKLRIHQPFMYYLLKSINCQESELEVDGPLHRSGKKVLVKNLQSLGFNKETAVIITQCIPDEFVDLQKPSFWAERYLDHVYRHHPLMSDTPRYPYNRHLVDQWFEIKLPLDSGEIDYDIQNHSLTEMRCALPIEDVCLEISSGVAKQGLTETKDCVDETCGFHDKTDSSAIHLDSFESETNSEDEVMCAVRMINISSDKSQGNDLVEKFLKELKSDENCLLFHGTTHGNAMAVIAYGIILTNGNNEQDFSEAHGFYLSDKFENAKAWSQAGRGEHQAVVVYNVKSSLLHEGNGLDLSQNPARWEEVVRCCRNGYRNRNSNKITKDIQKYAFIQGPPCKNPADSKGSNSLLPYEEAGIQLCIRDYSFAEEFGSSTNVACVIFY